MRDPVTFQEAMHRADPDRRAALHQPRMGLDQGHVTLLSEQLPDEAVMRLDLARTPVTATRLGNCLTMLKPALPPADRARRADHKMHRNRAATHAAVNRSNYPVPEVL